MVGGWLAGHTSLTCALVHTHTHTNIHPSKYDLDNGFGPAYTSSMGATSCDLCNEDYFMKNLETRVCAKCPSNAVCGGGTLSPIPVEGYWVDRSKPQYSGTISKCPRGTTVCDSGEKRHTNESCWLVQKNTTECSRDLVCAPGSTGPLYVHLALMCMTFSPILTLENIPLVLRRMRLEI